MTESQRYLQKPIPKIHDDEAFVVFNKPAGLLIFPTAKQEPNTLTNIVNHQYAAESDGAKLHPCHRLDKETSGAILYARGKKNQALMMAIFKDQKVKKKYTAFVHGHLKVSKGTLESRIRGFEQKRFHQNRDGKLAITKYVLVECRADYSILDVETLTGRNNQIRIQFSEIGHPLVGDRKYAIAKNYPLKFKRTALHARYLEWSCPISRKIRKVEASLSGDLTQFQINHP